MTSEDKPQILLLCLAYRPSLDLMYPSLFRRLSEVAHVKRAESPTTALREIAENTFKVIIFADEGLADYPVLDHLEVLDKVKAYVQNGGLAIVGLHFPCASQTSIDMFFKHFDLPWWCGSYYITDVQLNPSADLPEGTATSSLPETHTMRALHVANAGARERVYVPVEGKTKPTFGLEQEESVTEAVVAAARIGQGYLVYCGDVNPEQASGHVILAFCGVEI